MLNFSIDLGVSKQLVKESEHAMFFINLSVSRCQLGRLMERGCCVSHLLKVYLKMILSTGRIELDRRLPMALFQ